MSTFTFTQYANETTILIEELKSDLLKYMGCKSLKSLKKDSQFISMTNEIKKYQSMRNDLIDGSINEAKIERLQAIFN